MNDAKSSEPKKVSQKVVITTPCYQCIYESVCKYASEQKKVLQKIASLEYDLPTYSQIKIECQMFGPCEMLRNQPTIKDLWKGQSLT